MQDTALIWGLAWLKAASRLLLAKLGLPEGRGGVLRAGHRHATDALEEWWGEKSSCV